MLKEEFPHLAQGFLDLISRPDIFSGLPHLTLPGYAVPALGHRSRRTSTADARAVVQDSHRIPEGRRQVLDPITSKRLPPGWE